MLEKFLNDLGRDEWEIIEYHSPQDNMLAFTGLARRTTQRDWTLQDAAAAAAKAEAEKLRAEFAAKFEAATKQAPAPAEASASSFIEEKASPDDGFRKPVDTSRDDDPEAQEEPKDDWDKLTASEEEELPVFFDAIKPHMRRNQRGSGMSVGLDYLAKKWDQAEEDIKGALVECGFILPVDEDSRPEYLEYDGDLYWVNINRRGEVWINTKEKPRAVFRNVKGTRIEQPPEEPKPEKSAEQGAPSGDQASGKPVFEPRGRRDRDRDRDRDNDRDRHDSPAQGGEASTEGATDGAAPQADGASGGAEGAAAPTSSGGQGSSSPLPTGADLLKKIRPHMRRNRRGPGGSGSATFLARALRRSEAEITAAFTSLGLTLPPNPNDKPHFVEIGNEVWWLNQDSRGGVWINGRDKKDGETLAPTGSAPADANATGTPTDGAAPTGGTTETPAPTSTDGAAATVATEGGAASVAVPAEASAPAATTDSAAAPVPAPTETAATPVSTASADIASAETAQVAASTAPTSPALPAETVAPAPAAPSAEPAPAPAPSPAPEAPPTEQPATPTESTEGAPAAESGGEEKDDKGEKKPARRPSRPRTKKSE